MSGYGRGFWQGVGQLRYAITQCDEHEHLLCDNDHETRDWEQRECAICGGELKVKLDQQTALSLALQQIRSSVMPYTLIEFDTDAPTVRETLYWRGRVIRERLVPNEMRIEDDDDDSDADTQRD